jgi:hypothetical protein
MSAWVQLPGLVVRSPAQVDTVDVAPSDHDPYSVFREIPPERVGLDGEYDHNGLANRVSLAFKGHFSAHELTDLQVTQRGQVVVLYGRVETRQMLHQLIEVALEVHGAAAVETYGVNLGSIPESA